MVEVSVLLRGVEPSLTFWSFCYWLIIELHGETLSCLWTKLAIASADLLQAYL